MCSVHGHLGRNRSWHGMMAHLGKDLDWDEWLIKGSPKLVKFVKKGNVLWA